jgi:hypothetical protein
MTLTRRSKALVVIALVLAVAAALAVGLEVRGGDTQASTGGQDYTVTTVASDTTVAGAADDVLAADPAKEQPVLDQFESKNPFRPLYVQSTSGGDGGTTTDTGDDGAATQITGAKIKVNGTAMNVEVGDQVPGDDPVFTIGAINSNDVVFKLMGDNEFEDGSTSVTVGVGESVEVTNQDNGETYTLAVVAIVFADGSSGDTTASTSGHTFELLSINTVDGVALVTIEVDGTVYSDKKVGAVVSTPAGEVKIVAINEGTQSAAVLGGDANIVLYAGSTVTK